MSDSTLGSSPKNKKPMLGSVHINSDGYGYGARLPTERNMMTLPARVPLYRYPPESERYKKATSSTKLIKTDDHSLKRNADTIFYQTSGEYGYHYLGYDPEPVKLQKQTPLVQKSAMINTPGYESRHLAATDQHKQALHEKYHIRPSPGTAAASSSSTAAVASSSNSNNNSGSSTARYNNNNNSNNQINSVREARFYQTFHANNPPTVMPVNVRETEEYYRYPSARTAANIPANNPANHPANFARNSLQTAPSRAPVGASATGGAAGGGHQLHHYSETARDRFKGTLKQLDDSFSNSIRRDLYVASLPEKPMQELVMVATSNNHSAMQSKPWAQRLRRDSSNITFG